MSPRLSISQITTVSAPFDADLDAYRAAGADGIGIWEFKLAEDSLERFRQSGLAAATAVPAVPSILPLPLMERLFEAGSFACRVQALYDEVLGAGEAAGAGRPGTARSTGGLATEGNPGAGGDRAEP